jgi:hypothetical protein
MTNKRLNVEALAHKDLLCHKVSMTPTGYHMWQCFEAAHRYLVPLLGRQQ